MKKTYKEKFIKAVTDDNDEKVKRLIEKYRHKLNINEGIYIASYKGSIKVVKVLLNPYYFANPSYNSNGAIRMASEYGYIEIVKLLLQDKRVDPSDNNNWAIRYASENGYIEIVKFYYKIIVLILLITTIGLLDMRLSKII